MIMFLIRTAFWLSLMVLILPIDKEKIDPTVTESISAAGALNLASGALYDLSGFCVRNPDVCKQGQEAFHAFSIKAKYVSGVAYSYLNEHFSQTPDPQAPDTLSIDVPTQKQP